MDIRRQIHKWVHGAMKKHWTKILLCLLVLASGRVVVGMDTLTPTELERVKSDAIENNRHRHDLSRLSQAAEAMVKLAETYPQDSEIQLLALEMIYGHVTRMVAMLEYDSSYKKEFREPLEKRYYQNLKIGERMISQSSPEQTTAKLYLTLGEIAYGMFNGILSSLVMIQPALDSLLEISDNEKTRSVLKGLAPMTLGRMYYKIPWLLGGNKVKSEKYLELAKSINPSWTQLNRYLAETYYSLEMYDKAQDVLSELADVSPAPEDYQEFADELYYGCHFARKWGMKDDVVTKIKEKRTLFLIAHQDLPLMHIENAKLPEELQSKDCEV